MINQETINCAIPFISDNMIRTQPKTGALNEQRTIPRVNIGNKHTPNKIPITAQNVNIVV